MKTEMKDYLLALGMSTAFSDSADFSRINTDGGLSISRVIHKTFIELNEEGTEAAAVTAIEIINTSVGPGEKDEPVIFNANKPFIYAITEKSTGAVLFIGKMMDPTVSKVKN
jgi:serpin B